MTKAKMKIAVVLMLFIPLFGFTQEGQGIRFEHELDWNQIQGKAKAANKFIFVDCYATWCGPCKMMDKEVYPIKEVGDYFNEHFVSVKIQMDQTDHDDSAAKQWYQIAKNFQTTYSINSFPTFLFFSPDGKVVHKVSASRTSQEFIEVGRNARNSTRQYYRVVKKFEPGKMDTSELKGFIKAFQFSDKSLAEKMARDYLRRISKKQMPEPENVDIVRSFQKDSIVKEIVKNYIINLKHKDLNNEGNRDLIEMFCKDSAVLHVAQDYINRLPEKKLYSRSMLALIGVSTLTSKDRGFDFIYNHQAQVDSILHNPGWADEGVRHVIYKEMIAEILANAQKTGVTPDWGKISRDIGDKYNTNYGETLTLAAKVNWYHSKKDWVNYTRSLVEKTNRDSVTKYPPKEFFSLFAVNVAAFDIFTYSDNKDELETAVSWSNTVLNNMDSSSGPNYGTCVDTKANLLYKLGRRAEALTLEAKAAELCPKDKQVQAAFKNMKQGLPTWPVNP